MTLVPSFLSRLGPCLIALPLAGIAASPELSDSSAGDSAGPVLEEIVVSVPEPRFVAPTRRDRIGRIWAPVMINGQGPFRLVLDTGASHSGITAAVASRLGLVPDAHKKVQLSGTTGSESVDTVMVDSLEVGALLLKGRRLPIITAPLGGAEGILGYEGLADKRVYIDFRNDFIVINRSRRERPAADFVTVPITFSRQNLPVVAARIGLLPVQAVIDTGAQTTIANLAARDALFRRRQMNPVVDRIEGATATVQEGEGLKTPPITISGITIRSERMTFGDMHIFHHWRMTREPAVLIGMDALGLLDTLIIDYRRAELQMKTRY